MKILVISGLRVFPTSTGGQIRTGSISRALARLGHQVLVYSLAGRRADYQPKQVLLARRRVVTVEPNLTEETSLGLGFGLMQTLGNRMDYPRVWQHLLLARGAVPLRLRKALSEADIVMCDSPWCAPVPGPWRTKPWFLISHNLEYRLLQQGNAAERKVAKWMEDFEATAPAQFRDILACAEEDQNYFRAHDASRSRKVPLLRGGVDPTAYVAAPGVRERVRAELGLTEGDRLLLFSGSKFGPNLEALEQVRQFCRAEAEFLLRSRVFILALGSMCDAPFREGALIATGRVPEVLPYFAAADAGLNPVTTGSGANVKLVEYLAARLPVLSTQFGVRGTLLRPNLDFIQFSPETLKEAIQEFVQRRTPEEWRQQAEKVWQHHRSALDIVELVRGVIQQLPEFGVPAAPVSSSVSESA